MKIDLKEKRAVTPASAFLDMMGGKADSGIAEIGISHLHPFQNAQGQKQPFRMYPQQKLEELADNIRSVGVLTPVIARPLPEEGEYQILAGHNRKEAAKMAGLETVPCIVMDVDDYTAVFIMTSTNLNQRDDLLPSEKAFAYKMQLDAIKHQGRRVEDTPSATSGTMCQKSNARDTVAEQNGESSRNIQNYIRLTHLIKPLLDMVDGDTLPFRAGVNLSYLTESSQRVLSNYCEYNGFRITLKHSEMLKEAGRENELDSGQLDVIFLAKANAPKKNLRLPMKDIRRFFPNLEDDEIIHKVVEIIRLYYRAG